MFYLIKYKKWANILELEAYLQFKGFINGVFFLILILRLFFVPKNTKKRKKILRKFVFSCLVLLLENAKENKI